MRKNLFCAESEKSVRQSCIHVSHSTKLRNSTKAQVGGYKTHILITNEQLHIFSSNLAEICRSPFSDDRKVSHAGALRHCSWLKISSSLVVNYRWYDFYRGQGTFVISMSKFLIHPWF